MVSQALIKIYDLSANHLIDKLSKRKTRVVDLRDRHRLSLLEAMVIGVEYQDIWQAVCMRIASYVDQVLTRLHCSISRIFSSALVDSALRQSPPKTRTIHGACGYLISLPKAPVPVCVHPGAYSLSKATCGLKV